jgi:hypothetical protein
MSGNEIVLLVFVVFYGLTAGVAMYGWGQALREWRRSIDERDRLLAELDDARGGSS